MTIPHVAQGKLDRRRFLQGAGGSLAAGLLAGSSATSAVAQAVTPESITHASVSPPMSEKEKLVRIASNSYPIRYIFKSKEPILSSEDTDVADEEEVRGNYHAGLPRVHQENLSRRLPDGSMVGACLEIPTMPVNTSPRRIRVPTERSTRPGSLTLRARPGKSGWRRWPAMQEKTGTKCHHISNNAPRDICDLDTAKRQAGIEVAKKWLDGAAILGAKSMRVNSGGPRIAPGPDPNASGYPTNAHLEEYLAKCIESFKEMADYGSQVGVKVTLENHWGLTANPINIRIIVEEVNNPFCEASPDFCNWEHKYLLYHALNDLAPYAHTTVHAKFWDRFGEPDVQRNVRIMLNNNYTGVFALEYEAGPWDGVEGAKHLFQEVLAAM